MVTTVITAKNTLSTIIAFRRSLSDISDGLISSINNLIFSLYSISDIEKLLDESKEEIEELLDDRRRGGPPSVALYLGKPGGCFRGEAGDLG